MPSKVVQELLEQGQRSGLFSPATLKDVLARLTPDEAPCSPLGWPDLFGLGPWGLGRLGEV
jgi:hypothetical protein